MERPERHPPQALCTRGDAGGRPGGSSGASAPRPGKCWGPTPGAGLWWPRATGRSGSARSSSRVGGASRPRRGYAAAARAWAMSSRSLGTENAQRVPRLHVVAGDAVIAAPDWRRRLLAVAQPGRGRVALHLRARSSSAARLCEVAEWLVGEAAELGTLIVVNDRVDVALAVAAGGAQLREDSLGVAEALAVVRSAARRSGPTESPRRVLLLGRSIHSPAQAPELDGSGASWLLLGSVYPTPVPPGRQRDRPGGGRGRLRRYRASRARDRRSGSGRSSRTAGRRRPWGGGGERGLGGTRPGSGCGALP